MKKTLILIAFALSAVICNATEVTELKEAKIVLNPVSPNFINHGNSFSVKINESSMVAFEKDPLAYMKKNFDIKEAIANLKVKEYPTYQVTFKSNKGELIANFDNKGNLLTASFLMKNIFLPRPFLNHLYREYKGWTMIKNTHVATEKNGKINMEYYRITMKKGNEKKTFKINASDISRLL